MAIFTILGYGIFFDTQNPHNRHVHAEGPLTDVLAIPSNNIVYTETTYDISFTTVTNGVIAKVIMEFPLGTDGTFSQLIERTNIDSGKLSTTGGKTFTYEVSSPVLVPAETTIRLEIGNIRNAASLGGSHVTVTTKTSDDTIMDGPTNSQTFGLRQIAGPDIESNSISTLKIAPNSVTSTNLAPQSVTTQKLFNGAVTTQKLYGGAVTGSKIAAHTADNIAGVTKLIFVTCFVPSIDPVIQAHQAKSLKCPVSGASPGDSVLVTPQNLYPVDVLKMVHADVSAQNMVEIVLFNDGNLGIGPLKLRFAILVFHQ